VATCSRAIETIVTVDDGEEDDQHSRLSIKTADRPGLLVEIVKVLKDINVNVISAEVAPSDTLLRNLGCPTDHRME
jgi:UTP:GlnB (protein PII) uridylyltransferase